MEFTDEEIRQRLREAKEQSHARSTPGPPKEHVADSVTFDLVDSGVEMIRAGLARLGAGALVLLAIVLLLSRR